MKTKKLLMCILVGVLVFHTNCINAFAAEQTTTTETTIKETSTTESTSKTETESKDVTLESTDKSNESSVKKESELDKTKLTRTLKVTKSIDKKVTVKTTVVKKSVKVKVTKKAVKSTKTKSYSNAELKYLACLIQSEAGNQPYSGKLAVANVVLNRVKSGAYPGSIKGVIYDRRWSVQFTVAYNGMLSKELNKYNKYSTSQQKLSIKAAKAALEGTNNIGKFRSFTVYSKSLANRHPNHKKIGAHIFF